MRLYHGDCLEVMKTLEAGSVDAVVTDPPAGIAFMGKAWDKDKGGRDNWIAWMEQVGRECLRLIKPGGHALVWALPRTSHWTAMAWENAGWEVRDRIAFAFGSGFPKALDVGKAIDAMAGAEREVVTQSAHHCDGRKSAIWGAEERGRVITAPATDAAKQWDGWKSALKPAIEDWWLFRKPLDGTIAENVLKHGVGALNVEGCRVGDEGGTKGSNYAKTELFGVGGRADIERLDAGRYPSHLIHDGSDEVLAAFPATATAKAGNRGLQHSGRHGGLDDIGSNIKDGTDTLRGHDDNGGSASRFFQCCPFEDEDFEATRLFYAAKAGKGDRNEGCDELEEGQYSHDGRKSVVENPYQQNQSISKNIHPTVKSLSLMRYLCKLITPPGSAVLDCFMGSGSTGKAALLEGFDFIGIEQDADYFEIAKKRIEHADRKVRGIVREPVPGGGVQAGLFGQEDKQMGLFGEGT